MLYLRWLINSPELVALKWWHYIDDWHQYNACKRRRDKAASLWIRSNREKPAISKDSMVALNLLVMLLEVSLLEIQLLFNSIALPQ